MRDSDVAQLTVRYFLRNHTSFPNGVLYRRDHFLTIPGEGKTDERRLLYGNGLDVLAEHVSTGDFWGKDVPHSFAQMDHRNNGGIIYIKDRSDVTGTFNVSRAQGVMGLVIGTPGVSQVPYLDLVKGREKFLAGAQLLGLDDEFGDLEPVVNRLFIPEAHTPEAEVVEGSEPR